VERIQYPATMPTTTVVPGVERHGSTVSGPDRVVGQSPDTAGRTHLKGHRGRDGTGERTQLQLSNSSDGGGRGADASVGSPRWVRIFRMTRGKALLGLPDHVDVAVLVPLGWPRDRFGPTRRRPLGEAPVLDRRGTPLPETD